MHPIKDSVTIRGSQKAADFAADELFDADAVAARIASTLRLEATAICTLVAHLPDEAITLVKQIYTARGRVVFSGMGKLRIVFCG